MCSILHLKTRNGTQKRLVSSENQKARRPPGNVCGVGKSWKMGGGGVTERVVLLGKRKRLIMILGVPLNSHWEYHNRLNPHTQVYRNISILYDDKVRRLAQNPKIHFLYHDN